MAAKLDTSGWKEGLAQLNGPLRESLARSMAVAGGTELRDEAKRWVPVESGLLRDSIYLAYKDAQSTPERVVYSVSWNHSMAPHGYWIEFGHWQPYLTIYNEKLGHLQSLAKGKGGGANAVPRPGGPKWIAAKPFLRSAFDVAKGRAAQAMIERGRQRLPELLAENDDGA